MDKAVFLYSNRSNAISITKKVRSIANILSGTYDVEIVESSASSTSEIVRKIHQADLILMRDSFSIWSFLAGVFYGRKTFLEVNRPFNNFEGKRSRFFQTFRQLFFMAIFLRVRGIFAVTAEIAQSFGRNSIRKKAFYFPNFSGYQVVDNSQPIADRPGPVRFAFVGDLSQSWQGKERIEQLVRRISGSHLIYIGPTTDFSGDVSGSVEQLGLISDDDDILRALKTCHIGLSTLNFSTRKMIEASPLKHSLYVAAGLWIISGSRDQFLDQIYPVSVVVEDERFETIVQEIEAGSYRVRNIDAQSARSAVAGKFQDTKQQYLSKLTW